MKIQLRNIAAVLLVTAAAAFSLDVSFKIQETTGNPASDYPVTFVAPLPAWTYADVSPFRVTDANGATVPAQISILNKQWQAGYIRHLLITLKTSLAANEKKVFHLLDDGGNPAGGGLTVTETASDVTVTTGPLKFKVKKQNFNLFDEAYLDLNNNGVFETSERIISSSPDNGGIFTDRNSALQKSSDGAAPLSRNRALSAPSSAWKRPQSTLPDLDRGAHGRLLSCEVVPQTHGGEFCDHGYHEQLLLLGRQCHRQ